MIMSMRNKFLSFIGLAFFFTLCCFQGMAKEEILVTYIASPNAKVSTEIRMMAVSDRNYLFLPSSANLSALSLRIAGFGKAPLLVGALGQENWIPFNDGQPFDLLALFPNGPVEDGYPIEMIGQSEKRAASPRSFSVTIMRSANQGSVYIVSDDRQNRGQDWLHSIEDHAVGTTARMALLRTDGSIVYDNALREIRGRGNATWRDSLKRPYQIKLERKTNLLDNGDPADQARTWLLLADAFDVSMLHNAITLHLGQELGLAGTPDYQHVDLYYDGEYCGHYLLCEKVEIGPGRVDILDYGEYIETLYGKKSEMLDTFPSIQATNQYGSPYQYVEGVQVGLKEKGAYLLELDRRDFAESKSWIAVGNETHYAVQNPKYLSRADAEFLSCFLREMEDTIVNHGVHPVNGKTLADYVDLSSMAKVFLIHQYAKTIDFMATSMYFYIPEGESKLYSGPIWDFDFAYERRNHFSYETKIDQFFFPWPSWASKLMDIPAFQKALVTCFFEEFYPTLHDILLSQDGQGKVLQSLDMYVAKLHGAQKMNYARWPLESGNSYAPDGSIFPDYEATTYEESITRFRNYLQDRLGWIAGNLEGWPVKYNEIRYANVTIKYSNADVLREAQISIDNYYACKLSDVQRNFEAIKDRPGYALYTVDATLTSKDFPFAPKPVIQVNGYPVPLTAQEEHAVSFQYRFIAPMLEPAVYEDVDYGLIYQYDYFLEKNPEVLEECGDDPEAVLEYYVTDGIRSGLVAIETFDPEVYIENYQRFLDEYYMCDVEMSTLHYLENCVKDRLLGMPEPVYPSPVE